MGQGETQRMVEMPPQVRALYEQVPRHLDDALDEAEQRNPAAAQLFSWAVDVGRWALGAGTIAEAQQHPAWARVEDDLAAVTVHLARDPAVARLLEPLHVATVVYGRFLSRVAGAEAAAAWMRTGAAPLRVRRLWPTQRVLLKYEDGVPGLWVPEGGKREETRLRPVLRWHQEQTGLPVERRGRRQDEAPPEVFLGRLAEALEQLRRRDPKYTGGQKLSLSAIADQIGSSRQQLYTDLEAKHVDRVRLLWWRLGDPLPRTGGRAGARDLRGTS